MSAADTLRARVAAVDAAAADDLVSLRLVFSKEQVLALADLLDAIHGIRAAFNHVEPTAASAARRARNLAAAMADVERKARALEQAIERRQG